MDMERVQTFLLWCAGLNTVALLLWFCIITFAGSLVYRIHSIWFEMTREHFNAIHYGAMMAYKAAIFFFLLVPWLALCFMGP